MASRPDLTANSDRPLSADELEGDRAASPQATDPLDKPNDGHDGPASESGMADDGEDLEDREQDVVDTALTRLPPG